MPDQMGPGSHCQAAEKKIIPGRTSPEGLPFFPFGISPGRIDQESQRKCKNNVQGALDHFRIKANPCRVQLKSGPADGKQRSQLKKLLEHHRNRGRASSLINQLPCSTALHQDGGEPRLFWPLGRGQIPADFYELRQVDPYPQ